MKGLSTAVTCLLVLAAASMVAGVLQLAIIALFVWGALCRTRETLGLLAVVATIAFLNTYPWAAGVTIVLMLALNIAGSKRD